MTERQDPGHGPWLLVAASLFGLIFAVRAVHDDADDVVTLLYAIPIALVAVARGRTCGLAAAALALVLFAVWDTLVSDTASGALGYVSRAATFFVLGGAVGALADRLRSVLAASERFWEMSSDMLCTAGFDGYFKRLNPAWERTLGWNPEELCSRPFVEFVHEDDRARTLAESAKVATEGHETLVFENRYRCKDGSYRTLLWGARAVPEHEGLIYASARDVTESRATAERVVRSERFLDSVLENMPSMVFVKEAGELRFLRLNRAGEELLGIPRSDIIGKNDHDLFAPEEADHFVADDRAVLAGGGIVDIPEETIQTPQNGTRILHTRKIAIRDEDGEPRYLLGISVDITERKRADHAAAAAGAEIERANRAKNEFLSRMSHELRTPLNAVIGFGQLLALDELEPTQEEAVEQIVRAGRHLLELINEVLDISRIESESMALSLEPVHVGSVLADALSLIRPLADEAHVTLVQHGSERIDVHALADQQRLKQVLINQLSNAVKYNRRGGEVHVRCCEHFGGQIEISVTDTGHGMTPAQLARVFEPFDRLGAEATGIEGTGLGLSLSRGLVHAMGGTIEAESEPGVGSTMRVHLCPAEEPREAPDAGAAPQAAAHGPQREPRTIVYVEDNLSNLKLVDRLLTRLPNIRLIPAMNGILALELVRERQPDLVLLDLHLPDLHGREVLRQLRADPVTAGIPIVVLSADATPAQVEHLMAEGADGYLTKPIDVETLLETVLKTLQLPTP